MTTNDKKESSTRDVCPCMAFPRSVSRIRLRAEISRRNDGRASGSIDAFIRPIIVVPTRSSIANIYAAEHAALIFIACKLLYRPRCISVVFATIGPISAVSDPSLRSSWSILSLSLSLSVEQQIYEAQKAKSSVMQCYANRRCKRISATPCRESVFVRNCPLILEKSKNGRSCRRRSPVWSWIKRLCASCLLFFKCPL